MAQTCPSYFSFEIQQSTVTVEDGKLVQKEYTVGGGEEKNCTYIRELDEKKDLKIVSEG